MAPPTKAPPRKAFKEIYILAYRFIQIHVGDITETEVFFATYNTDGNTNYVCPYAFFPKLPDAAQRKVDMVLVGAAKVNHSVTILGMQGAVLKYDPLSPIALNELTGSTGSITTGNVGIAAQRGDRFLVRINIDNDPRRDGRDFRAFMLEFQGTAPKDLIGKTIIGSVVPLSTPVVAMQPWGIAEKQMTDMYRPFQSIAQP
jgi:hypothetical protein